MRVGEIVRETYRFNFSEIPTQFPLIASFMLVLTALFYYEDISESTRVGVIVRAIPEAWFAFVWHRLYLLNKSRLDMSGTPVGAGTEDRKRISGYMSKFIIRSILFTGVALAVYFVSLLAALVLPLDMKNPTTLWTTVAVVGFFVLLFALRLLPYFPAISVGKPMSLSEVWAMTSGKTFRIFAAYLGSYLPILFGVLVLIFSFSNAFLEEYEIWSLGQFVTNFTAASVSFLLLAFAVTTNSEIYRQLTGFDEASLSE